MTPTDFVSQLRTLRFSGAFNPYSDRCLTYDLPNAPRQRVNILTQMLDAATRVEVESIWVGRDLGHRGGRRTGLALTDDVHFQDHLFRWGVDVTRPTLGKPVSERTAAVIWGMLHMIDKPVFLWNVFPLHPHQPGDPFTNRTHNAEERRAGIEILHQLIGMLRPKRLVAIGNDAELVLAKLSTKASTVKVRHPSYGGQAEFSRQVGALYGVRQHSLL